MKEDFYETPEPSWLMKIFWKASGGDPFILEKATYSDQVKYMCLGGIIAATGVMAAIAGGYAFYTIFEPRGSAIESQFIPTTAISSVVFGILWGLMIFNLDRFIVSSTGKGDGTEAITWLELKGAIPRIILGTIIALTISKPVEIRMFKSEIDAALHEEQLMLRKDYETRTRANYEERLVLIQHEIDKIEGEKNGLKTKVTNAEKELTDQLQGRAGAAAGDGKLSQALKGIRDKLDGDLSNFDSLNKPRLDELGTKKDKLIDEMDSELGKNEAVANGLDGLLERIKLAHKIAGFWISLFITLLFVAIELTPIFFKLMLVRSPYDYLKDNIEELIKAQQGIHIEANYYKDKKGQERDLVTFLHGKKILLEKKELHEVQKRLTKFAIEKYEENMKAKITANPENFIKSNDSEIQPNEA
jgi:hypothetical protein